MIIKRLFIDKNYNFLRKPLKTDKTFIYSTKVLQRTLKISLSALRYRQINECVNDLMLYCNFCGILLVIYLPREMNGRLCTQIARQNRALIQFSLRGIGSLKNKRKRYISKRYINTDGGLTTEFRSSIIKRRLLR